LLSTQIFARNNKPGKIYVIENPAILETEQKRYVAHFGEVWSASQIENVRNCIGLAV